MMGVGVTERRENFPAYAKIRVVHVGGFECFRHAQSNTTKFSGGHDFMMRLGCVIQL
jgi:hypothetical protein